MITITKGVPKTLQRLKSKVKSLECFWDTLYIHSEQVVWENGTVSEMPTLDQIRDNVKESLRTLRQDHKRSLNPTPYKVEYTPMIVYIIHP